MGVPRTISIGLVAALAPYLYGRVQFLSRVSKNDPATLPRFQAFESYEIKFADRIRNCEDVLLIEDKGLALLSCDPGRDKWNTVMGTFTFGEEIPVGGLWVYNYGAPDLSDDDALQPIKFVNYPQGEKEFHPLGIEYHESSSTLYVSNHHSNGTRLETFQLSLSTSSSLPTATYQKTLIEPLLRGPNSIAAINRTDLYVTNDHFFLARQHPILSQVETYGAIPGGTVVHVDTTTGAVRHLARVPFANGIAFLNDSTVAVASTTSPAIYLFDVDKSSHDLTLRTKVHTPSFMPDNLSVDSNGALLIAGHAHPKSTVAFKNSRVFCRSEAGKDTEQCKTAVSPSWVAEWTEEGGLKDLYVGTDFSTSSTVVRDPQRKIGIISGLYEYGLLVWKY